MENRVPGLVNGMIFSSSSLPSTFTCFILDLQAHGRDTSATLIRFSVAGIIYTPLILSGHNQRGDRCVILSSRRTGRVSKSVGAISGSIKVEKYNQRQTVGKRNKWRNKLRWGKSINKQKKSRRPRDTLLHRSQVAGSSGARRREGVRSPGVSFTPPQKCPEVSHLLWQHHLCVQRISWCCT